MDSETNRNAQVFEGEELKRRLAAMERDKGNLEQLLAVNTADLHWQAKEAPHLEQEASLKCRAALDLTQLDARQQVL